MGVRLAKEPQPAAAGEAGTGRAPLGAAADSGPQAASVPTPIAAAMRTRRVLVVVGAGGVGKTTLSAALGLAASTAGKRALVLTVDPARRLANALGLQAFDQHTQVIPCEALRAAGIDAQVGVEVAMLDIQSTFDRVVTRHVNNAAAARAIMDNPFYRTASTALAGSQEYMAIERLAEVVASGDHDLIVLDTPPSAHALDFLEAPQRLIDLFENRAFRALLRPFAGQGTTSGMFARGSLVMRGVGRFTSADSFHDLLGFFGALSGGFDSWVARGREVLALLRSEGTAFLVVSGTDDASRDEAQYLLDRLRQDGLAVEAWLVNRVATAHVGVLGEAEALADHIGTALQAQTPAQAVEGAASHATAGDAGVAPAVDVDRRAERLARAALAMARIADRDRTLLAALRQRRARDLPLIAVSRREVEPADLGELGQLAAELATTAALSPLEVHR